ncbi:ferritin-like domain-containing protein [Herbaspirillum autotrophicum]|uniref:ferritin-like domain-containing protein n=1 Tax=Herbaspirillum autotrophicum TaxID=180195 RepID=UPI00067DC1AF|nr:ferritin-like domain-containing protein [Herbaspirillum autotrophicum]
MNPSFLTDFDQDQLPFHPELRRAALAALLQTECTAKQDAVATLWQQWQAGKLWLDRSAPLTAPPAVPGRPLRPELVSPLDVKSRSMRTAEGRAALIHALAHIEFNAINLALDAIWRFPSLPDAFYADWLQVAHEEAFHFSLLAGHLQALGFAYGDFPAHNSLWDMAEKTQGDVLARIALVPRTMEARGLDAVPAVRAKLAQAGDQAAAEILDLILRDEVGHVAIGNRWYAWLCEQRGVDTIATFAELVQRHKAPVMRGPFNFDARRAAGFTEEELQLISAG